jgi:trans-aconitate methyltransferase
LENAMTTWNPDQYLKFSNERTRPALDLASQIEIKKPKRIIDLGCGTGTSTEILAKKWPQAEITGLDSSEEMLNKAQAAHPNITWVKQDLNEWIPDQKYDIIFSNASLEWVSGTALGPYLQVLGSEKERVSFKADLLNFYRKSFPASSDGKVIFPFNRQFLIAYK